MLIRDVNIHRRDVEKQDGDKSEGEKSVTHEDDSKKPTEPAETKPTEAYGRSVRGTDEHTQESSSPKPTGETTEAHKDESKHKDK
jgi:hypothetical protein